jgi:energy-coupling factor transporter ATP-binding protein EcfA2
MRLKNVTYREFAGTLQEWSLEDLSLQPSNLLVGKNATGKSRTLNIINGLSRQLERLTEPGSGAC